MKLLLTHSDPELAARESIDLWRIIRPFNELSKHLDWQIDHQPYLIDHTLINKTTSQVKTDKLMAELGRLGQYDIVWTSYFPDAVLFDCMIFMSSRYDTQFVLDIDDDMYHIPHSNPIWRDPNALENIRQMQYMIEQAPHLVTSSPNLQAAYEVRREHPTYLWPNYIGPDYAHKPFDNGDTVVIVFFGGAAHLADLRRTGCLEALRRIMIKYPQVHVGTVGLELDNMPPRYTYYPGKPGQAWLDEVWPHINADISVAPLINHAFNRAKTNIKWLETALIPAAFVGSDIPPYQGTVNHGENGLLVRNTQASWYHALEKLVLHQDYRRSLAAQARREVRKEWSITSKWRRLAALVEKIHETVAIAQ